MSDKVREQFEAWCRRDMAAKVDCFKRNRLGEYVYYKQTGLAWAAWQASRAAALEEAAKVCDDEAAEWEAQVEAAGKLSSITKHAVESTAVGARRCARRISALAGSGA